MRKRTYLDGNAGAPLLAEVKAAMVEAFDAAANASSVHAEGREARRRIEASRASIAVSVSARPENVILTSGGTEAAALALSPHWRCGKATVRMGRLYAGATEHPCVRGGGRFPARDVTSLPVNSQGVIELAALDSVLAAHDPTTGAPLVALMLANNETGAVQPIAAASEIARRHGGYMFCDAVQGLGKIPVSIGELGADAISISAHKIGGPQGAGALVLADEAFRPEPITAGGGQERGRRSGTENLISIIGFGVATQAANSHLREAGRLASLRARLEAELLLGSPEVSIASAGVDRLPNTTLFIAPGIAAETAVIALDLEGVAVSAGSACSSGKVSASHVLEAMGVGPDRARCGIRVSLLPTSGADDVEAFIEAWRVVRSRIGRSKAA